MKAVEVVAEQRLLLPDYMVAGRWEKELTITGVFPFSSTVGPGSVSQSGLSEVDLERSPVTLSRIPENTRTESASGGDSRICGFEQSC